MQLKAQFFFDMISRLLLSSYGRFGGSCYLNFQSLNSSLCRSQWSRGLRSRSAVARLLRLRFRIQPGAWMFFCCECCVQSGRCLCEELITRPEESYRMSCVVGVIWKAFEWGSHGPLGAGTPKTHSPLTPRELLTLTKIDRFLTSVRFSTVVLHEMHGQRIVYTYLK
jgi:hypothetical protein